MIPLSVCPSFRKTGGCRQTALGAGRIVDVVCDLAEPGITGLPIATMPSPDLSAGLSLTDLLLRHARPGRVEAIYLRPARGEPVVQVAQADAVAEVGLAGDRSRGGKRQLSLIQAEHLPVIASLVGLAEVDAALLRRNVVVSGINLTALKPMLKGQSLLIRLDEAVIELSGECAPCSRMEAVLGLGGYNAMRGHGGFVARIVQSGRVRVGGEVRPL